MRNQKTVQMKLTGTMVFFLALCLGVVIGAAGSAVAYQRGTKIWYASPKGDDKNPGDEKRPFRSIRHAFIMAQARDQVYVTGGIYEEKPFIITRMPGSQDVENDLEARRKKIVTGE